MCHFWSSARGCCKPWEIKCQWECPEHSSDPRSCPDCGVKLEMYEHYDEYDDTTLQQEQHFECPNCHHTFACMVWYKQTKAEWFPDEED